MGTWRRTRNDRCPLGSSCLACVWWAGRRVGSTLLCEHSVRWPSNPGKTSRESERWGVRWKREEEVSRPKKCPELGLGTAWHATGAAGSSVWPQQRAGVFTDEREKELVLSPSGSKRKNWACTRSTLSHNPTSSLIAFFFFFQTSLLKYNCLTIVC